MATADLDLNALQPLYTLARSLLKLDDLDAVLDAVVAGAFEIVGGERGFLVLDQGDGKLDLRVVRNWQREELEGGREPVSRSIVSRVLETGETMLVEDALSDARFAEAESVLQIGIRSVLAAPLEVDARRVGALYLESRSLGGLFGEAERERFRQVLDLSSRALERATRLLLLQERTQALERDLHKRFDFQGILTRDPAFLRLLETVGQVASSELPVLVQGASGTGKELIVRALHVNSRRAQRPLVTVNCGAISASLLESELFGHVKGAFTGAVRDKLGLFAAADQGTLFLDEVGELPLELQPKLLRTLQFGEVLPVGSTTATRVDVRVLAATNRDLETEVEAGRFREDLLYRLNVVTLDVPPLAERPGDILPLFYLFLERAAEQEDRPLPEVTPRLERRLEAHDWPGNVRELENEARRLLAITPVGEPLTVDRLSPRVERSRKSGASPAIQSLAEHEKEIIELHLKRASGNRTRAAESLGISREGLRKKMKRFGLDS
ncbi:MAG: sigma 54-interacting transcriptional regulator [Acidobacteriota bacterium]